MLDFLKIRGKNSVAIELFRKGYEVLYFNETKECDFIVKNKFSGERETAIQVTRDLNIENEKREIGWLLEAMKKGKIKKGIILTYNQEEIREKDWFIINIMPAWKWMTE